MTSVVRLGYAVGSGAPVEIPVRHTVITGITQEAGKTTALEALIARSGLRAVTFITKRGEGSFAGARRIDPYFRERADWQFVSAILEASRGEKLKFERSWIMRASKGAHSLADVHENVQKLMKKSSGLSGDIYMQLDAYLDEIVPQLARVRWAPRVELRGGVNAVDMTTLSVELQHLVIRSTMDWVLEREEKTVVVVPEAWKFVPEGRNTPVKLAAESFIRQGAGLGDYLWLDSQDIAGVEKKILKQCPVWILGVQRERNEIKTTLDNIPASVKKPKGADIATLGLGQFYACWGTHAVKTYVQPAWLPDYQAEAIAIGVPSSARAAILAPYLPIPSSISPSTEEPTVKESEARNLRDENQRLARQNAELSQRIEALESSQSRAAVSVTGPSVARSTVPSTGLPFDEDELYCRIKQRLIQEAPAVLRVLAEKPELRVEVTRNVIEVDGKTPKGRIARLIAKGWFDGDGKTQGGTRSELARTGADVNSGNISTIFSGFVKDGFLTAEAGNLYRAVPGMKVNIVER